MIRLSLKFNQAEFFHQCFADVGLRVIRVLSSSPAVVMFFSPRTEAWVNVILHRPDSATHKA